MLIRFRNHESIDLSQLTSEIYPIGLLTVHPKIAINTENRQIKISSTQWHVSHTETGTSIGTFSDRIDAVLAAQSLGCLASLDNIMALKGNKPFKRAVLAIVKYHNGESTTRGDHGYPK